MVAKRPEDRPQSMGEVVAELEASMGGNKSLSISVEQLAVAAPRESLSRLYDAAPQERATAVSRLPTGGLEPAVSHPPGQSGWRHGLSENLLAGAGKRKVVVAAIGLTLLAAAAMSLVAVSVRMRGPGGMPTPVTAPATAAAAPANEESSDVLDDLVGSYRQLAKAAHKEGLDSAYLQDVASAPAEQQVQRVVTKLKELNTGYDGKVTYKIEDGQVVEFEVHAAALAHVSPIRALSRLTHLDLGGPPLKSGRVGRCLLSDLTPLEGLPLAYLDVSHTQASDLASLRGMPLVTLFCHSARVVDLSPLKDVPLKELQCDFNPNRDSATLRSIKTLERINGLPVAQFWKLVAAGIIPEPIAVWGQG
jgi:hypothetical protein